MAKRVMAIGRINRTHTNWRSTTEFRTERKGLIFTTEPNGCPCINCKEKDVKTLAYSCIHSTHSVEVN